MLRLWVALFLWFGLSIIYGGGDVKLSILFILCVLGLGVYPLLLGGWGSRRKYSVLGGIRALAQTISYEVILAIVLLVPFSLLKSLNLEEVIFLQIGTPLFLFLPGPFIVLFLTSLAELNRTPFDLREGERELVSGFNTEYNGVNFVLYFLAEYRMISFIGFLLRLLFLRISRLVRIFLLAPVVIFLVVLSRRTFPRIRYDQLISLTWSSLLVGAIAILIFYVVLFNSIFL